MPEADVDYPGTWNRFMDLFSTGVKWIPPFFDIATPLIAGSPSQAEDNPAPLRSP